MISIRQRIVAVLDKALDWCVENWRALIVLLPAGTFVVFSLVLFFGLTVSGALAITKTLVAVEIVAAGAILALNLKYRSQISQRLDAADAIEAMICKDDVFSDWDDFIADPASDPEVERIRLHCLSLPREFRPVAPDEYCNQYGVELLQGYVRRLRGGLATSAMAACSGLWSATRARKPSGMERPDDDSGAGFEALSEVADTVSDPIPAAPVNPIATSPDKPVSRTAKKTPTRKAPTSKAPTRRAPTSKASPKKALTRKASPKKATTKKATTTKKAGTTTKKVPPDRRAA